MCWVTEPSPEHLAISSNQLYAVCPKTAHGLRNLEGLEWVGVEEPDRGSGSIYTTMGESSSTGVNLPVWLLRVTPAHTYSPSLIALEGRLTTHWYPTVNLAEL